MAEIMEQALDIALDKKDLKIKRSRRLQKTAKRKGEAPRKKTRPDKIFAREQKANSRYIPSQVRERVHDRAGHQCEFRAQDGTRCRWRTGLQTSTCDPLLCIEATTRDFSDFTARRTIV